MKIVVGLLATLAAVGCSGAITQASTGSGGISAQCAGACAQREDGMCVKFTEGISAACADAITKLDAERKREGGSGS